MPTPECPTETLELGQHLPRAFALDALHQLADRHMWRNRYENMHMISRNMSLESFHIPSPTNLAYKPSGSIGDLAGENLFAILRSPHQVVFQIIGCMCMAGLMTMLHAIKILKSSPKGEGFSPIPRRGH